MKARCGNKNNIGFYKYGAVGISYVQSWGDFSNFLRDMGERPDGTSLDRIDPRKGYSPENCRWADAFTQSRFRQVFKTNKTGITGVHCAGNRWRASLSSARLGTFSDFFEACCARKSAENKRWKESR